MIIYRDRRPRLVSLVINIHNCKDIVVASETLGVLYDEDAELIDNSYIIEKKITSINGKTCISLTGMFDYKVQQFIKDFALIVRQISDFENVFQLLIDQADSTLTLDSKEDYRITLAGFSNKKPVIRSLHLTHDERNTESPLINYMVSGYEGCTKFAIDLLEKNNVQFNPKTSELKQIVKAIVEKSIKKFPELLGGTPDVKVLHRD
jgi:hypothetical protein